MFSKENIESAAKLTFGNVVLISLFCTLIDGVRRWYTVTRPVRRIAAAAEKVMAGDLSVRIQPVRGLNAQDGFNVTIRVAVRQDGRGEAWRLAAGMDASQKMLHFMDSLAAAFANGLPSFHPFDLCIGIVGAVLVRLAVYLKGKNANCKNQPRRRHRKCSTL